MSQICAACNGACCSKLPFMTANQILVEVQRETLTCVLRIIRPDEETGKTVCAFWLEDEGCVLEENERPAICGEFKCDLFLLSEKDPALAESCSINGHILMIDPFNNDYSVLCDPECSHKANCPVSCRQEIAQFNFSLG